MATPNRPASQNKYPEQYMDNTSFDETYHENTVEILGEDAANGTLKKLQADSEGRLKTKIIFDESNTSAFGDPIVTDNTPVVQLDFVYGINTQTGLTAVTNSASVDTDSGRLRLQSGTNSAGSAIFQSRRIAKYRAGQGMTARFTPLFTVGVANSTQIWGVGSGDDGYLFGFNGVSFGILHRNRTTDNWTTQANWNVDKLDGTGLSGFNWLDKTKGVPVMIRYAYLGYGDAFFFVQNPDTGRWILCHILKYANSTTSTQVGNPSMRFYGQCLNSGNTTNLIMYCGSVGIFINGPRNFIANPKWGIDNNKATVTTEANIFTIQNATTYNTIKNMGLIRLSSLSWAAQNVLSIGTATLRIKRGSTLGGNPSYTTINGTTADNGITITSGNSIASYDVAGTTVTNGILVFNDTLAMSNGNQIDLIPYDIFLTPGEILTFSVFCSNAATTTVAVNWTEDI